MIGGALVLDLVEKGLVTDQMVLTVGYDIDNLKGPNDRQIYHGEIKTDHYGRAVPKHAHGTANLGTYTSSTKEITNAVLKLYDSIVNPKLLIRRLNLTAAHVLDEASKPAAAAFEQLDLFMDYAAAEKEKAEEKQSLLQERRIQETLLSIKKKYGKNAILKGINLQEGSTAQERNRPIGGHKA